MFHKKQTTWNNRFFYGSIILGLSLILYAYLPVPFTLYVQPNDGYLKPADAITLQTPLQQCIDGNFENVTALDILLATYGRVNTNTDRYEIFTIEDGNKRIVREGTFASDSVKDNDYYSIGFRSIPTMGNGKFCFLITSADGTPQNGITYWLNSQSQPVLKLKSTMPLHTAMEQIVAANRFHLPIWPAVALCLLYLGANIGALFLIWHEKTAPSHSRRARQKRI